MHAVVQVSGVPGYRLRALEVVAVRADAAGAACEGSPRARRIDLEEELTLLFGHVVAPDGDVLEPLVDQHVLLTIGERRLGVEREFDVGVVMLAGRDEHQPRIVVDRIFHHATEHEVRRRRVGLDLDPSCLGEPCHIYTETRFQWIAPVGLPIWTAQ